MPKRLRPQKWERLEACGPLCSLGVNKLGEEKAEIVHGWFEQGLNDVKIGQNAFEMGLSLTKSSIGRHRANHLRTIEQKRQEQAKKPKISDLDALEKILQQGADQIEDWKVTPSDYFKALDMKYRLTQGSVFQGMLEALAVAEDDDIDSGGEETEGDLEGTPQDSESPRILDGLQEEPPL